MYALSYIGGGLLLRYAEGATFLAIVQVCLMQDSGYGSAHTKLTDPCCAHVLHMFTCTSDAMTHIIVITCSNGIQVLYTHGNLMQ